MQRHSIIGLEDLSPSWKLLEEPNRDDSEEDKASNFTSDKPKREMKVKQSEPTKRYNLRERLSQSHESKKLKADAKQQTARTEAQPKQLRQKQTEDSEPTKNVKPQPQEPQTNTVESNTSDPDQTNSQIADDTDDLAEHHDYNLRSKGFDHRFPDSEEIEQELGQERNRTQANIRKAQINQIDIEEIIAEQNQDTLYGALWQYLDSATLPDDIQLTKKVIALADHTLLHDEAIYRCPTQKKSRELYTYKLVIPSSCVPKILKMIHNDYPAQHFGILKTFHWARKRFYWPAMYSDIQAYIGNCSACLQNKRSQHRANPPMALYDKVEISEMWHCDLVGPLPMTKARNQYIAVCVDRFSRYLVTFPMRRKTQEQFLTGFHEHILTKFGICSRVHTDLGREFCNDLFQALCKTYNIQQTYTSDYHSCSNGLAERMIQNIVNLLRTTVNKAGSNWDVLLPQLTFQLNTTVCKTTGYSPYYLMFGTNPKSFQLDMQVLNDIQDQNSMDYIDTIHQNQKIAWEAAAQLTKQNQLKMKQYYDRDKTQDNITVGSYVYLYRPVTDVNAKRKFAPHYVGPFQCVKVLKNHRVQT